MQRSEAMDTKPPEKAAWKALGVVLESPFQAIPVKDFWMIGSIIIGLPALLVGAIIFSFFRWMRGGPFLDPGPRSIKEFLEQRRTIVHPQD